MHALPRCCIILLMTGIMAATPVRADPAAVAPTGWDRSENGRMTIYRSPSGTEAMIFRIIDDVEDPAVTVSSISDGMAGSGAAVQFSELREDGPLHLVDMEYRKRNIAMRSRTIGVRQQNGGYLVMVHVAPKAQPGLGDRLQSSARKMAALASTKTSARAAASPSKPASIARAASGGKKASEILFELTYNYGVGGAVYPKYDLVALFGDGTAAKLGSYPADAVDVAAIKRKKPGAVGRWTNQGAKVRVRWGDGDESDLKRSVGPPRALPGASALTGSYQSIGGGGNIAMGGTVIAADIKRITFSPNGRFSHARTRTASSNASVGRSRSGSGGRWSLSGSTLTLNYDNGPTVRTSLFYSGTRKNSSKGGRYGVLWIGGNDYRRVN